MCAEVSSTYFYVIHHEMGHCQYFLAYNTHQNYFFQVKNYGLDEVFLDDKSYLN